MKKKAAAKRPTAAKSASRPKGTKKTSRPVKSVATKTARKSKKSIATSTLPTKPEKPAADAKAIVYAGRHLKLVSINGWESCERTNASGVVASVAVTADRRLLLTEQYRPPVGKRCVELPAGLAGDIAGSELESLSVAAQRELLEETGFSADRMEYLTAGPASAGLTSEVITFFRAVGVHQVSAGGGDETEQIVVHAIPLSWLRSWLREREAEGLMVDYKIFAGLYLAGQFPS